MEMVPHGSVILDVGCGSGLFLGLLVAFGRISRGLGVDILENSIVQANRMKSQLPGEESLSFKCVAADTTFPDGDFDVVSAIDVMHHVLRSDQKMFFRRLADRVPAGGRLVYKDIAVKPLWRVLANQIHDIVMARQWVHVVPGEEISAWAGELGLRQVEHRVVNTGVYSHELFLFERNAE